MKILFIGDIFGNKGIEAVTDEVSNLKERYEIDFTIANAENTTNGKSLSIEHYETLSKAGIQFFTFGNHTWHLDEIKQVLSKPNTVRPLNLREDCLESKYGEGTRVILVKDKKVRVTNLLGMSVDMKQKIQTNPFLTLKNVIESDSSDIHIVDFHCETTSEKNALLLSFAGSVSAILGTHTHIQTNDNKIYNGTAYITDVGMTGGSQGVIGAEAAPILDVFNARAERFKMSPSNSEYQLNAVVLTFDDNTNRATNIEKINILQK